MRVLLVNKFYAERGGAERCFLDQERWLRAAGHEVRVFAQLERSAPRTAAMGSFVDEVAFDRGPLVAVRGVPRLFWSGAVSRALDELLRAYRPDVAVLHNVYHHLGPPVALALHARRVPTVMVLHDHKPTCPAYSGFRSGAPCTECSGQRFYRAALYGCGGSRIHGTLLSAEAYLQWRVLRTYQKVDRFVAPSAYLKTALERMGFTRPVDVVRNAVEPAHPPEGGAVATAVGFAGRLVPEKGASVLVRAAARLPDVPFRVAGDGPERAALEAEAKARGAHNVTFLGRLTETELGHERMRWRIAVVPSLSPENFPYAALDAMNQGVPVIGSATGGLPELLEGRGCLVPAGHDDTLAESVRALWYDERRRAALSAAALTFVDAECRPARHLERLLELAGRKSSRDGSGLSP